MARVVEGLEPIEYEHPISGQRHRFWFENAAVGRPTRDDVAIVNPRRHILLPRDCREGVSGGGGGARAAAAQRCMACDEDFSLLISDTSCARAAWPAERIVLNLS